MQFLERRIHSKTPFKSHWRVISQSSPARLFVDESESGGSIFGDTIRDGKGLGKVRVESRGHLTREPA